MTANHTTCLDCPELEGGPENFVYEVSFARCRTSRRPELGLQRRDGACCIGIVHVRGSVLLVAALRCPWGVSSRSCRS